MEPISIENGMELLPNRSIKASCESYEYLTDGLEAVRHRLQNLVLVPEVD